MNRVGVLTLWPDIAMVQRAVRSPTPPPVIEMLQDQEDDPNSWYWDEHGGGMVIDFGKHKGRRIHEVSLSYLLWCRSTFLQNGRNVSGRISCPERYISLMHVPI